MISYNSDNKTYTLKAKQKLPISMTKSWNFFSTPKNLSKITPGHMNIKILTDFGKIYEGQIIKYKGSPFPFLELDGQQKLQVLKSHSHSPTSKPQVHLIFGNTSIYLKKVKMEYMPMI